MLVSRDPVVPLEQQRLDHRGQLHVKVEEIYCKCDHEEREASGQDIQQKLKECLFHFNTPPVFFCFDLPKRAAARSS